MKSVREQIFFDTKRFGKLFFSSSAMYAFTLAEVLITLGIIGVVAAMTIPTLLSATQEQEYKTGYKKAYSVASSAWQKAASEGNIVYRPSWQDVSSKITNFNAFKANFKVVKDCNSSNNSDCWASGDFYYKVYPASDAHAFVDASGMAWSLSSIDNVTGAELLVDINGKKKPNSFGQDRFVLKPITINSEQNTPGVPIRIVPQADILVYDENKCAYGATHPCYYTTWLLGN